ncbi:MAG: c-type cytochrome [Verrucomicrobiales bacterium]|nr:c-type cytochrome [Verrucomicrobiales bacterium]
MKSFWTLIAVGMAASALAADKVDTSKLPPVAKKDGVTFASDIKPIFEKSCVKCHGPEKQKGKLRLDTLEATLKGSEDGAILTKGKSVESPLVHSVARLVEDDAMPPEGKGDPLTKEQIGLVRAWIDQGAK